MQTGPLIAANIHVTAANTTTMNSLIIGVVFLTLLSCEQTASRPQVKLDDPQTVKDTCDNPDAPINCSFLNMPSSLTNTLTIAGNEGEELVITGTVYHADGKTAYPGIIIYAYHTDSKGYYSKKGTETGVQKWHGRLHGWCKTDNNGNYKIKSIRPARYPDNTMPAHIHAAIKKENGEMYWISDFVFKDDDLVNEKYLSGIVHMVGGTGVVNLKKNANTWTGTRDIVLTD